MMSVIDAKTQGTTRVAGWWRGILLVAIIAVTAMMVSQIRFVAGLGLSSLTLAILFGIVFGNSFFPGIARHTAVGVDFSKQDLLRFGVMLYGFRITFSQIMDIGWSGVLIDMLVIVLTFSLAFQLGTRIFKLDRSTVILIGAGSSICGAAAVMATESVIGAQAHKVSVAVATVVVFGTLGMFIYPLAYPYLQLSEHAYGIFAGSTIHEVAQVVAAGKSISDVAANSAVVEKMLRVMMLAPFLLVLSAVESSRKVKGPGDAPLDRWKQVKLPWFALVFILICGINSLQLLPAYLIQALVNLDTVLLTMAMTALGLRTHIGAIRQAGAKPLLLAAVLFLFLTLGGYLLNYGLTNILHN
jgi:uncharacterized integral membrane protein (TIGR00698 family)